MCCSTILVAEQADTTQHLFYLLLLYLLCFFQDLTLEIFNKCRLRRKILPLVSQREFVLLYNGVFSPDSTVANRKSIADSEFHQKIMKKTQKSEPIQCKVQTKGKNVPFASSDNSANVSVSDEGRGHLKSDHHCSTSTVTSPLHESLSSVQGCSHLNSSNNGTQSVRRKNPRPRAELKLSKCILHHHVKAAHDLKHSKTQTQMRLIMSLSSSAVTDGTSAGDFPETTTLPTDARHPVCVDKHEKGQKASKEELRKDAKSLLCERKEELWFI